jgi:hypothetical protein
MSNVKPMLEATAYGNVQPAVLPNGNIQLVKNIERTTVEFDEAKAYLQRLQTMLFKLAEQRPAK